MNDEVIDRPATAPARPVQPSAASALPSAELEQRHADMIQRRDAAELKVIELEERQGRALAEHGAEDPALEDEVVLQRSQARKLSIACDVLAADIEVAKKRERRDLVMAARGDLVRTLTLRKEQAVQIAATLATLCDQLHGLDALQRDCVAIMNGAKRIVPVGQRKGGIRVLESTMAMANPAMLPRWVAISTRASLGEFWGIDVGGLSEPFDQIVTNSSAQVLSEFDWLLDVAPTPAE